METGQVFVSHTSDMALFPAGRSFVEAALGAVCRAGMAPVDMRYFAAVAGASAEYCRQREATVSGRRRLIFLLSETVRVPDGLADADPGAVQRFRQKLRDTGMLIREFTSRDGLELEAFHALRDLLGRPQTGPAGVTFALPPDAAAFTGREDETMADER